jgi:hypothetical protein
MEVTWRENASRWVVALALVCVCGDGASAQPAMIDLHVNTYTTDSQGVPAVAIDADGNFVVVWQSYRQDGSRDGIFGRRFDGAGAPLGPEFQVNTYTTNRQRFPAVAMRSTGEFVVVWQDVQQYGMSEVVFGRLFDPSGNPASSDFQVSSDTTVLQRRPAVEMDESGRFVVVWEGSGTPGQSAVWGRRFDASGMALGDDFTVSSSTGNQGYPSVGADGLGNFVVVWQSGSSCSGSLRAFGQRFDSSGAPQGSEFPVGSGTTQRQVRPRVAVAADGSFMVAWEGGESGGAYSCGTNVVARAFDASGVPAGSDIQVDTSPPPADPTNDFPIAIEPSVAADQAGNFVVAWVREVFDDAAEGLKDNHIRVRRFGALGVPDGPGFPADTSWQRVPLKSRPAVAVRTPGRFIVGWDRFDVWARSPDVIFSDGLNTGELSAWSSAALDGGDGGVSTAAAMAFPESSFGLQVTVDDRAGVYVQDDSPAAEPRYRARFYLDPNGYDPGESVGRFRQHVFLAFSESPFKRLVLIMLRRIGGQYAIGAQVRRDDDTLAKPPFFPISDGPHAIEFDWQKATAPGANDGRFEMWVDGTSVVAVTGLDTDERSVDFVRMGALSVKEGASGTLYFDEFVSRRLADIGP